MEAVLTGVGGGDCCGGAGVAGGGCGVGNGGKPRIYYNKGNIKIKRQIIHFCWIAVLSPVHPPYPLCRNL